MPAKTRDVSLDFAFFVQLWEFYKAHRGLIRRHYRELSRRFLDYNNPENTHAFLRQPQFEALEMYIFLKEYLDNAALHTIFREWADHTGRFTERGPIAQFGGRQYTLFEEPTKEDYDAVFKRLHTSRRAYPNYIFALTMGTGKTILMATCIFYEFILANKFPQDPRYCHNALVFAPDTTVLQSLLEIKNMDMARVVPPEYANLLNTHLNFHFLDEAGTALSTLDRSRFNIIISNTQKIILKRRHTDPTAAARLFKSAPPSYQPGSVYEEYRDLYDVPEGEADLIANQRFHKLQRLEQLGIYVDEAHHAFGSQLARDMGLQKSPTSLRLTIDELAAGLDRAGTRVVACYNYTGTPYVGDQILPEVVYTYSLRDAIDKGYLKQVRIHGYTHPRSQEFIDLAVDDFLAAHPTGVRYEGMTPKLAFFAATIDELQNELRPAVEAALQRHRLPLDRILVNVGDEKLTSSDDIRDFNRLDTPASDKQFILLVNKGREGWNCRSLFGVGLFREPKSKIFVLQATMRCLRSITDTQQLGRVYLSQENIAILDAELQQNFRITVEEINHISKPESQPYTIHVHEPVENVTLTRLRRAYRITEKPFTPGFTLGLAATETERYHLLHTVRDGLPLDARAYQHVITEDLTPYRTRARFTELTLVAEIARYLNRPCVEIARCLAATAEGLPTILDHLNRYNELLYDHVIPSLFHALYNITGEETREDYTVALVKLPPQGASYEIHALPDLVVHQADVTPAAVAAKSFHLDPYCFDSRPERVLFWDLLRAGRVQKLYFTGMLTHGQSDFYIQYIDPDSHTVRSYYPDFLAQKDDGSYLIVEVKGDNRIDDAIVQAKQTFAQQMALASGMTYQIIKASDATAGRYHFLLEDSATQLAQPILH